MHSLPVIGGHISVTVETIVKGFEEFSLLVPMLEWAKVVSSYGHRLRSDSLPR